MEKKFNKNDFNRSLQQKLGKYHFQYLNEVKRDLYCSMIRMGDQLCIDDMLFTVLCNLCSEKIRGPLIKCPRGCITEWAVSLFKAEKMKREEKNVFCADYD